MSELTEKISGFDKLTPQKQKLIETLFKILSEENGGVWKQGWRGMGRPVSATTGKGYRGVNRLFLSLAAMMKGYSDNRWVTYKQMTDNGWTFKTDEEGRSLGKGAAVGIEFYELWDRQTKQRYDKTLLDGMTETEISDYEKENVYPLRKHYNVFNADVIEGIPKKEEKVLSDDSGRNERAENFINLWSDTESKITYGGDKAYYSPTSDEIRLPDKDRFYSLQEYYGTALHEIGHSTGHETRLNRDLSGKFGSEEYAKEELRAELASMFMEQDFGVELSENHIENNGRYIRSWKEQIAEDPNTLFTAIADAEKIAGYVSEKEKQVAANATSEFIRPSELAAGQAVLSETPVSKNTESLTQITDREVIERAVNGKSGEKFMALYNGENVLGNEEKSERSLMARLAVYTKDKEQLQRLFKSSGQYREEKPNSYYSKLCEEAIKFVSGHNRGNGFTPISAERKSKIGQNAKA